MSKWLQEEQGAGGTGAGGTSAREAGGSGTGIKEGKWQGDRWLQGRCWGAQELCSREARGRPPPPDFPTVVVVGKNLR